MAGSSRWPATRPCSPPRCKASAAIWDQGLIKGIGPKMAERIVTYFALDTLRVIEEEPERLIEVPGLGPKRTAKISAAWEEQKAIKEVMVFLQGVGVSTSLAIRIYKTYRDASISIVQHDPYRLASDVWGIGFKTADKIAQSLGIPPDSPERIKAGLQYTLSEASDNGHCYLPLEALIAEAAKILEIDAALIEPALDTLVSDGGVVRETLDPGEADESASSTPIHAIYLVPFYRAEVSLANGLLRLLRAPQDRLSAFHGVNWEAALGWLSEQTGATLAARTDRGGATGADAEGRHPHRRTRLRQELHRALHRRLGARQEGQDHSRRPHRTRRQAAGGAGGDGGEHAASTAAAAPWWRRRLRP